MPCGVSVCLSVCLSALQHQNWPYRSEGEQVWCGPMCASRFFTEDQRDLVRVFDVLMWIAVLQILQVREGLLRPLSPFLLPRPH